MRSKTILTIAFIVLSGLLCIHAQAPSHDPTSMIRSEDGRYWIFTTGDGIWCMSSSNKDFGNWRAEPTPFPAGTWPSWINSAVPGFSGAFWAPAITKMNGYYYLYYSCSTFGSSRSAIGVVRTSSLSNPNWTDLGMVVSSNGSSNAINAIDPAIFHDSNGRVWMSYGSFFGGLGVVEINPSTGKTIGGVTKIAGGNHQDIEAPYIIKNGNYYYLFVNRGSCCNGVNSTYYVQVARSTSITGPYSGYRTFVDDNGRYIGPGHIGYGEDRLTYHYYDGQDNGNAKLYVTTLGWSNGWPVLGGSGGWNDGSNNNDNNLPDNGSFSGTYSIIASHSGKALDTYNWGTSNGTNIVQWSHWGGDAQQFVISPVEGEWHRISPKIATGQALDVDGISTSNGANIFTWSWWGGEGQQFKFENAGSGQWKIIARHSNKCFDIENNSSSDGANLMQWSCVDGAGNQKFELVSTNSASVELRNDNYEQMFTIYPVPATEYINIEVPEHIQSFVQVAVINHVGQRVIENKALYKGSNAIQINTLKPGIYYAEIKFENQIVIKKFMKQ